MSNKIIFKDDTGKQAEVAAHFFHPVVWPRYLPFQPNGSLTGIVYLEQ